MQDVAQSYRDYVRLMTLLDRVAPGLVDHLRYEDLIEHSGLRPCGKNASSDIGGQIHISSLPVVVADEQVEIPIGSDFQKFHGK